MSMYCKLFASLYQGTLRGKAHEILVFTNLLAHCDKDGFVDKHFRAISEEVGLTIDEVKAAIAKLEAPDPESRSPELGGARLERIDEHRNWGWRVVNYLKYRTIRDAEDRREQSRIAQAAYRYRVSQSKPSSARVSQSKPQSAHVEVEGDGKVEVDGISTPEKPPPSPEHKAFIDGWCQNFKAKWQCDYKFIGGRDGKAVKGLLATGILRIDLLEIAKKAWEIDSWNCKQSRTISGFYSQFNNIHIEVKNGNNKNTTTGAPRFVDRNAGTANAKTIGQYDGLGKVPFVPNQGK